MYWLPIEWAAMSRALTSGRPPPSSVASVRDICEVANLRATWPSIGTRRIKWCARAFCPDCRTHPRNSTTAPATAPMISRNCVAREVRHRHDHARRHRQLRAETGVEIGERRDHLQHDDRHQHQRQRGQNRRIDQRRHGLALHRRDDLGVLDEAPEHRVEVAAPLPRQQRRGVDARKQRPVRGEGVRHARCPIAPVREHRPAPDGTPATRRAGAADRATAPAACRPSAASPAPG